MEEELYEAKKTQAEILDQLRESEDRYEDTLAKLNEAEKLNTDIINELEKENDEMKALVGKLRVEIKDLRNQIYKLKHSVYIPKKHDKIDTKLAEYINHRPEDDKMRIMFLRESEGVYRFGQKRVYIKIEKGDQIFVRVGGGFMGIEEFIHSYSQFEADKIVRHDVVNRF